MITTERTELTEEGQRSDYVAFGPLSNNVAGDANAASSLCVLCELCGCHFLISKKVFILFVLVLLSGCQSSWLSVRSEPLYPSYLASEQVNTPDPWRICFAGQQIVMQWNLPRRPFVCGIEPLRLLLTVRFGDYSIETYSYEVKTPQGYELFPCINQEYWDKGGIIAFKVELFQRDLLLEEWRHHVWAEIIDTSNW